jgi:N utilization substance protein A
MQEGYDSLVALPGVGISLADALYEKGFFSAGELSKASIEDLIQIRGVAEGKATKLIEAAKNYTEKLDKVDKTPKEVLPDDGAKGDEISAVSDVQEVSEEDIGDGEDMSGQVSSSDNVSTDDEQAL